MEEKVFKSINGNDFIFKYTESNFISPLEGGYIITPSGEFIPVKDDEDHSTVFSDYLSKYLEKYINLQTIEAAIMLGENNHIVYMGIKTSDMRDVNRRNGTCEGFGILIFPKNIRGITPEQKESCGLLIASNKSIFGNREKIPMQYHSLSAEGSKEYTKDDILGILESKSRHV